MDIRQQLQRLLDIADDARRRAAELSETHADAPVTPGAEARRTGQPARRRSA
jgi:hypothetical protein